MTSNIILEASNIFKYYNLKAANSFFFNNHKALKIPALSNISFQVEKSERIGIIGSNGSGKTTLCKIISGVTFPTSGTVGINGKVSSVLEAGTGFDFELSGHENIFINGAILGMARKEIYKRVNEIVKFSEIEEYIYLPVKKYSSGMIIKLAFAIASFLDGEIVILDEILAVADEKFRQKCIKKIIRDCKEKNKTLFLVSHDIRNILETCTKVIYLKKGQLISFGETKSVISIYQNEN